MRAAPARTAAVLVLLVAAGLLVRWLGSGGTFLDPERPGMAPDVEEPAGVPASEVAAPVRIPLAPLTALMEESVPTTWGGLEERRVLSGRDRTEIAFHLERAPLRVAFDDDGATVGTTIGYALRVWFDPPLLPEMSASCGTDEGVPRPRLSVTLRGPVTVDRNWALSTDTRVVEVVPEAEDRDRCRVTFLGLDVTDRVVDAARGFLEDHVEEIDSLIAGVDVRSHFQEWWRTLQSPIRLTDSLWLAMGPEAVQRGAVRGSGDSLEIALALRARPTLVYGRRPTPDLPSLPPLDTGRVADGLDLRVEARVEYGAASDLLRSELRGRELEHDGRLLRLDSLEVFGIGGGRVAVEVVVSGDVRARLYLVGTPEIDTATARISVPDLAFDVETRNVVLATATWLRAEELRDLLRERARWPAAPAVRFMTGWLARGLNRDLSDDLRVEGEVESVRILGVHAMREALLVRVAVRGSARLFVVDDGAG